MSIRKVGTIFAVLCASLLLPAVASAQTAPTTTATSFKSVPVSGKAHNGKAFSGRYTVDHFVTRGGKTYAEGTLTGKIGQRSIKPTQVMMPTNVANSGATGTTGSASATCPILHLDLGPLNLNLLGLNVHLNEVILDITATSGPGNLLGNLLCGVSNLLNTGSPLGNEISGLLNIVQSLVGQPALLTL
jgi:hypothetical protein